MGNQSRPSDESQYKESRRADVDPTAVSDSGSERARSAGADAILATTLLTITIGLGITAGARPAPVPFVAGTLCTIFAEGIAGAAQQRVRTWWANQWVRVIALWGALAALTGGVLVAPTHTISAAVGALITYLVLFGLVATGILSPPGEWLP